MTTAAKIIAHLGGPAEESQREVNDRRLAAIMARFAAWDHIGPPLVLSAEEIGFLLTHIGQSRSALRDIEETLTLCAQVDVMGESFQGWGERTLAFIHDVLSFDETQIGLDPDNMPPEIAEDEMLIDRCPWCGGWNTKLHPKSKCAHPFTRIAIARCLKEAEARNA